MDTFWKNSIWQQFGAAIDMLENAVRACPDELWSNRSQPEFWYLAFHALFFLDYYLTVQPEEYTPPSPFTMDELDPSGKLPERTYTKSELLDYARQGKEKCQQVIRDLTEEAARAPGGPDWLNLTMGELLIYNMRHVQHHAAQLNLMLRQNSARVPRWVRKADRLNG